MHDYLLPVDGSRLAFVLGIIASLLLYERRHLSTGSVVVPGYIGAFLLSPIVIVVTLANAVVVHLLVARLAASRVVLYGRGRYTALALTSVLVQVVSLAVVPLVSDSLRGIGLLIPGLIAHDMARQGVSRTAKGIVGTGVATGAVALLAVTLLPAAGGVSTAIEETRSLDVTWIPLAVLLAIVTSAALLANYGLRSGGFIGGVYLGLLAPDPADVVILLAIAAVTFILVTRVLRPTLMLFGRRKFASMMLVSSMLSWITLSLAADGIFGSFGAGSALPGLALAPLFVPGLIANDVERAGLMRTTVGVAALVAFVVPATELTRSAVSGRFALGPAVVVLIVGAAVFGPQLALMSTRLRAVSEVDDRVATPRPTVDRIDLTSSAPSVEERRPTTHEGDDHAVTSSRVPRLEQWPAAEFVWSDVVGTFGLFDAFRRSLATSLVELGFRRDRTSPGRVRLVDDGRQITLRRVEAMNYLDIAVSNDDLELVVDSTLRALSAIGFATTSIGTCEIELVDADDTIAHVELHRDVPSGLQDAASSDYRLRVRLGHRRLQPIARDPQHETKRLTTAGRG